MDRRERWRAVMPAVVGLLLGLAAIVYIAASAWHPAVTQTRDEVLATPSLPGLATRTDVVVRPRHELCVRPVTIPARTTRVAAQTAGVVDPRGLRVSAIADGRRLVARRVGVTGASLEAYFDPRGTTVTGAAICFANRERRPVAFVGTTEARSRV